MCGKALDGNLLLCPDTQDLSAYWEQIEKGPLQPWIQRMAKTPQESKWHGEGDVWTHTRMVCEELLKIPAYRVLPQNERDILFAAALLHDVAKPACTMISEGEIITPRHTVIGERLVRTILWTEFDMCGTREKQQFREAVCALVRYHSVPLHLVDQHDPILKLRKIATIGTLVPHFTLLRLSLLVEADIRGRISQDKNALLESLSFFTDSASELGCLNRPPVYASPYCRYAVLNGRNVQPEQELFDDTWGPIIMLSGLPGTGKDTYIRQNLADLPMISLDDLRFQLCIRPERPQGIVIAHARALAREYLRKKQVFVWNATNTTPYTRENQVHLFNAYGAATKIIYLETNLQEMFARNRQRSAPVPESVIEHLLESLSPPTDSEAYSVEWICN